MSKIDQKSINIFLKVADMLINHTGLVILIICWIYLFKVGTFGCETEFGVLLVLIALFVMILCIINPAIFV